MLSSSLTVATKIEPSEQTVADTLNGNNGPVVARYRFERRTRAFELIDDISSAVMAGQADMNNDRDIALQGTLEIDLGATQDDGTAINLDMLKDHVAVFHELNIDGYWHRTRVGFFHLSVPGNEYNPGVQRPFQVGDTVRGVTTVAMSDLTIHLVESTTIEPYTVSSGTNYITAVQSILDDKNLNHSLPSTDKVLPNDKTWDAGIPWIRIVNDLLKGAGFYSIWTDTKGVFTSRRLDDLSSRTPDVTYTDEDFIIPPVNEEFETTRFANQVIVIGSDPNWEPVSAVVTNDDPDSSISTVTLGRTITKVMSVDEVADESTAQELAQRELEQSASLYQRVIINSHPDPRRRAREVYSVTIPGLYEGQKFRVRNWSMDLTSGIPMTHTLSRVERVQGTVS